MRKSAREHRLELSRHLAGVLSNPETPADLYNRIWDVLGELEANYSNRYRDTPEYVFSLLDYDSRSRPARRPKEQAADVLKFPRRCK